MTAPINVTNDALDFIQRRLAADPTAKALRLGIKKSGCSGFSYDLKYINEVPEENNCEPDILLNRDGVKILIASESVPYLKNTIIDCIKDDFGEYLKFLNPNVKGECGCGESVSFEEK